MTLLGIIPRHKRESNPGSSALGVDALTTRPARPFLRQNRFVSEVQHLNHSETDMFQPDQSELEVLHLNCSESEVFYFN